MGKLVLMRHGESAWNAENRFTGWIDVGLNESGRAEARHAGALLVRAGLAPDIIHTSLLQRASATAALVAEACGRADIPVHRTWRLNERHYGALQGHDRTEILTRVGPRQFDLWRRSYTAAPPPIDDEQFLAQSRDPRYAGLPPESLPRTESLADVTERLLPYWRNTIQPDLATGQTVAVVAHGNSLRALIRLLDEPTDREFMELNVPTGMPVVYDLDDTFRPVQRGGRYLDADAARTAIAAVARQGRTPATTTGQD